MFVATGCFVAAGLSTWWFVVGLGAVVGISCTHVRHAAAAFLALSGWAFATGFGVNELGELTFEPGDLARLATYVGLGLLLAQGRRATQ